MSHPRKATILVVDDHPHIRGAVVRALRRVPGLKIKTAATGRQCLVAVRAWEPPMADLADVLSRVQGVAHCSLCLVPLPGKEVTEHSEEEWSAFARELPLPRTSADALRWS